MKVRATEPSPPAGGTFDAGYFRRFLGRDGSWHRGLNRKAFYYRALLKVLRRVPRPVHDVVEIGCGVGYFSDFMALLPARPRVWSADLSDAGTRIARAHLAARPNVAVLRANGQAMPFRDESADLVVSMDVVEHLHVPERFFEEAHRVLRPGGAVLFSTPNPASLGHRLKGGVPPTRGLAPELRSREWFGYRDDTHVSIRAIRDWRETARRAGLVRLRDGTDLWWDTPYFDRIPLPFQKVVFNGSHRVGFRLFGFLPWGLGENYYGLWRKAPDAVRAGTGLGPATPRTRSEAVRAAVGATR